MVKIFFCLFCPFACFLESISTVVISTHKTSVVGVVSFTIFTMFSLPTKLFKYLCEPFRHSAVIIISNSLSDTLNTGGLTEH